MFRHVSALTVGHLQWARAFFFSICSLCFNFIGRNCTYD